MVASSRKGSHYIAISAETHESYSAASFSHALLAAAVSSIERADMEEREKRRDGWLRAFREMAQHAKRTNCSTLVPSVFLSSCCAKF